MSAGERNERRISAREALLEAAEELFTKKAYSAVGTRELADAAAVNLGAIQYHFGSKARLFVETVRRLMQRNSCCNSTVLAARQITGAEDAAVQLCSFIRWYLEILLNPQGPPACRIMFREIFSETAEDPEMYEALVSSMVNEVLQPVDTMLIDLLKHFAPAARAQELELTAHSIIGQCTFYATHRSFVERMRGASLSEELFLEEAVDHLCRFSLRGVGCPPELIEEVLARANCKGSATQATG